MSTTNEAGRFTLQVAGELDLAARDGLVTEGQRALTDPACTELVLDMAGVTFIDSSGVGGLVELRTAAIERDQQVTIVNPSSRVHRLLELTGLGSVFLG
ncbi:STAS domain-containing protein [Jatrophihabitans sp. GAS493]|uniref:STAS domain-containing protein n=1 Tax=Jatrophihabitans sp. GAS493 TaxID=1907575 RepID=UPI0012FDA6C0|nr:STAS domain-containing protein [Jatrophihabitans sp. GAS493]